MFYTSFWLVSYCFFTKKSLSPLSSLCKLYHEADCHRFDEYKQTIVESLWDCNQIQGTEKNIPQTFFREHVHLNIEMSSCGRCSSQEFDLDNIFTSMECLPTGNLLRFTWKTHFKYVLDKHWKSQMNLCKLIRSQPP